MTWNVTLVESAPFPCDTVLKFNPVTGYPGMAYVISMGAPVHFAEFNGSNWLVSNVAATQVWKSIGLSYLANGIPVVAYAPSIFGDPSSIRTFVLAARDEGAWGIWSEYFYLSGGSSVDLLINNGSIYAAYFRNYSIRLSVASLDDEGPLVSNGVAIPNPAPVNADIVLDAVISDATTGGSTVVAAQYSVAGSAFSNMDPVDGLFDQVTEDVTASFNLADFGIVEPGVYEIRIVGIDACTNVGPESCLYLVVYDPSAGFVTGGGWIWSPAGALAADPLLEGRANFGFVARYKKGAAIPTGNTEFQFQVAGLNFHSDNYDWLVVAGAKAMYKGTGTVNGEGPFKFMLTAGDGELKGNGVPDTFRIRIWQEDETGAEITLYDNQMGDDMNAEPSTTIEGGSIIIHK